MNVEAIRAKVAYAFICILVGAWAGYALAYRVIRTNAIQNDCAYYDGKTGEFKWRMM
mgnify:CR=1 FL=1